MSALTKAIAYLRDLPPDWLVVASVALSWVFAILLVRRKLKQLRERKDGAYEERNRVVAALARTALAAGMKAGLRRTNIPGWNPAWHNCVYIDLPTGQVSWHYHDSHAHLFEGLPAYDREWDGHETPEKYRRVHYLFNNDARRNGAP